MSHSSPTKCHSLTLSGICLIAGFSFLPVCQAESYAGHDGYWHGSPNPKDKNYSKGNYHGSKVTPVAPFHSNMRPQNIPKPRPVMPQGRYQNVPKYRYADPSLGINGGYSNTPIRRPGGYVPQRQYSRAKTQADQSKYRSNRQQARNSPNQNQPFVKGSLLKKGNNQNQPKPFVKGSLLKKAGNQNQPKSFVKGSLLKKGTNQNQSKYTGR